MDIHFLEAVELLLEELIIPIHMYRRHDQVYEGGQGGWAIRGADRPARSRPTQSRSLR